MNYNSYFVYGTVGGFIELTTSNQYIFTDASSNDILIHTDYSNQNLLFGTDSNNTSHIRISQSEVIINRDFYLNCNFGIGIHDYSERLVVGNGNAKFLSNSYTMNNAGFGTSNVTHLLTLMGPSNNVPNGPSITSYFSSATPSSTETSNPVFQIMNWDRDDIQLNFDSYNTGPNILSTTSNGNFQIRKNLGRLQFMSTCNHATGDDITSELYPALTINSNSYIGIGTRDPTHRLTIRAPQANIVGPHMAFYIDSDSNHPLRQIQNWDHDDISDAFDSYYNAATSNWISSSSTGNFKIHKQQGRFVLYSACNAPPGSDISSDWTSALAINSNSFIGIGTRDPTHQFTMRGLTSNLLGPHTAYYVNSDSNYPVFQQLNWNHDEISLNFDNYFDGYGYISSSAAGNFQLRKRDGRLKIMSACNTPAGSNITNDLFIAFAVNSNSYIGIGTEDPTHRFTIRGPTSNFNGPHTAFYIGSDSNNPVYQQLNWNHDDITQSYDVYFDPITSNWLSSSSTGNFQIRKNNGRFMIFNACNTIPGSSITNDLFPAITINSNSFIGIATQDPTHRFTMRGPASNINGPHTATYINEDSNHPLTQILNWNHDDIIQSYDAYFNPITSNWISSSSTGNFLVRKNNGRFMIFNSCNTGPGSNITNDLFPAITINSNSFIGIATQDPTHRFTMRGPASNINGPHTAMYINEDSNNPVYQQLNWNHDQIYQGYDAYFNHITSNWISSSSTGNFVVSKNTGRYIIQSACNTGPNSNITNDLYIALAVNSNSFIGIANQDPTRRITVRAEDSNILGPHMNFYVRTDSNYPVYEHLNWTHDDITQSYDASYDGSNWISSSSTGNFQIKKKNGRLMIFNACNVMPGSNITNAWFPALTINNNSYIGIGTSNPKHRLAIQGPSNSILGPHIATYLNDSNNPAFQIYTSNNNMISLNFDSWWNGYNYISSSSNANFQIVKREGKLIIQNAPFVYKGDIVTFTPAFTVNSNNYIGIRNSNPTFPLDVVGNSIFRDSIIVAGSITPASNMQYDIGTATSRFRDIYLSGNSINMQDLILRKDFLSGGLIVYNNDTSAVARVWAKEIMVGDPTSITNSNVFLITASSNGIQLQNITSNLPPQNFSQLNNLFLSQYNVGIGISNAEKTFHLIGDFEQNPITTAYVDWTTNSVLRFDVSDIKDTVSHHDNVNAIGTNISTPVFATSNGILPPVYLERGGYNDAPFIRFDSSNNSKLMLNSNLTINSFTNSGLTISVLARFYDQITPGETIINLDNNGFKFNMYRDQTDPSVLVFETNEVTIASPSGTINQNEWALFTVQEVEIDSLIKIYKNGTSIASTSVSYISDMSFIKDANAYLGNGNVDIGALYIFDRPLFVDELSNLTRIVLDSGRQSMQVRTKQQSYPPTEFYQDTSGWQQNRMMNANPVYSKTISSTYYGNGTYNTWANTELSSSPAIYAFDLDNTTSWTSAYNTYTNNGGWAPPGSNQVNYPTLYLELPNKLVLEQYVIGAKNTNAQQTPTTWKIYGSTNGQTWALIEARYNEDTWTTGQQKLFTVTTTTQAYKYFKLEIHENDSPTQDYISVGVWQLYGKEYMFYLDGTGVGLGTALVKERLHVDGNALITSNLTVGITNDDYLSTTRTYPTIPATASNMNNYTFSASAYYQNNSAYNAIKAFDSNASTYWMGTAAAYDNTGVYIDGSYNTTMGINTRAGDWLQIKIPDKIKLESYTITPRQSDSDSTAPTVFYVGGSTDGTTWYAVDSQRYTWQANSGPLTFRVSDPNKIAEYSYFRLVINEIGPNLSGNAQAVIVDWQIHGGSLETMTKENNKLNVKGDIHSTGNFNLTSKYYDRHNIVSLDVQELMATNGTGTLVEKWGKLNQDNAQYRPIFYKTSGYKNAPYIRFQGRFLTSTAGTLNMTPTTPNIPTEPPAGITITCLLRFTKNTASENVVSFATANLASPILLTVTRTGTTNISFTLYDQLGNQANTITTTTSPITQNEWMVLGIRYRNSIKKSEIFINNTIQASSIGVSTLYDTSFSSITIAGLSTNIDIGGLFIWDRALTDEYLFETSDIMMQGQPQLNLEGTARFSSGIEGGLTVYGQGYNNTVCIFPAADLSQNDSIVKNKLYGNGVNKASCSAYYQNNDNYDAYNAFQSLNTNPWKGEQNAFDASTGSYTNAAKTLATNGTSYGGEWLQLDLPQETVAIEYSITPDTSYITNAPKSWYFFGSKNGIDWDLLDTQTNYSWISASIRGFTISNTTAYLSYRIVISGAYTDTINPTSVSIKRFYVYANTRETTSMQDGTTVIFDKLGINTTNPAASLHVAGFSVMSGLKIISTGASNVTLPSYQGSGSGSSGSNIWSTNSLGVYVTSNVGINGIPDINAALAVYGDLKLNNNNGTVAFYSSNGNLGINTPNPAYSLQVNGTTQVAGNLLVNNNAVIKGITIRKSNGSIPNLSTHVPGIGMSNDNLGVNILTNNTTTSQYIKFLASNVELARFTGTGNFGIGITNPTYQLQLGSDSAAKPSTATWTVTSDSRLKENIESANLDICYNNIKNIPLRRYTWSSNYYTDEHIDDRTKIGWIAQEVERVFPKAVATHNLHGIPDCKTLNSDQIYATLFGAVQKLQTMVETLTSSHTATSSKVQQFTSKANALNILESKVQSLEKQIKTLQEENYRLKTNLEDFRPKNVVTFKGT